MVQVLHILCVPILTAPLVNFQAESFGVSRGGVNDLFLSLSLSGGLRPARLQLLLLTEGEENAHSSHAKAQIDNSVAIHQY